MIIKIFFTQPTMPVPVNNQHPLNGYIHEILGKDNKWHDCFSRYSISSLQGGKLNKDMATLSFPDKPYIVISSLDKEFISTLMFNIMDSKASFFGMKYADMNMDDFKCNKTYDKVMTISPIIVKYHDRKIAVDNPKFIECLINNCKEKLAHEGIHDDTFNIELPHPEKAKIKNIFVGDIFNICTLCRLTIYGKPETRKALYNMGLGGSTGSGFGAIKIYSKDYQLFDI